MNSRRLVPIPDGALHGHRARPAAGLARALVRGAGGTVVCGAALARGQQLHPGDRDQRARDVAGGDVRSGHDRQGARAGRGPRDDDDARVPARPALAAGCGRLSRAHRSVPRRLRRGTASSRSWCCSIRAGIRIRGSVRSGRRRPASTTPAGCRVRARRPSRILPSTRACART